MSFDRRKPKSRVKIMQDEVADKATDKVPKNTGGEGEGEDAFSLGTTDPPPDSTAKKKKDSSKEGDGSSKEKMDDGSTKSKSGDFWDMVSGIFTSIPIKMMILLYIVFIIINSTVFIEYCIEPLGKTYHDANGMTNTGTYLQGLFLVVGYTIMYALTSNNVI